MKMKRQHSSIEQMAEDLQLHQVSSSCYLYHDLYHFDKCVTIVIPLFVTSGNKFQKIRKVHPLYETLEHYFSILF